MSNPTREEEAFLTWIEKQNRTKLMALLYGEAAVRCADIVDQAAVNGYSGFWLAIRLSDGGGDEIAYASKSDAINHQLHEQQCCYIRIPPDGMMPKHAESVLRVHRMLYSAGMRIVDPDNPRLGVIRPL